MWQRIEGRVRLVEFQDAQHWEEQRLEELYGFELL